MEERGLIVDSEAIYLVVEGSRKRDNRTHEIGGETRLIEVEIESIHTPDIYIYIVLPDVRTFKLMALLIRVH